MKNKTRYILSFIYDLFLGLYYCFAEFSEEKRTHPELNGYCLQESLAKISHFTFPGRCTFDR